MDEIKECAVELVGGWIYLKYPSSYSRDEIAAMVIEYVLKNDGTTHDVKQIII